MSSSAHHPSSISASSASTGQYDYDGDDDDVVDDDDNDDEEEDDDDDYDDVGDADNPLRNLCQLLTRYLVITKPFTYALKRTPLRMSTMIALVWLMSAGISIPPQFGWRKPVKEGRLRFY